MTNVLVLGASGMLGSAALAFLSRSEGLCVTGTVRSARAASLLPEDLQPLLVQGVDVEQIESLAGCIESQQPDVIINCVGVVKQLAAADNPLTALPINALLPHQLERLCRHSRARLIHVSTDCVFSGAKGSYREADFADADDLYGRSKFLGEVDSPHAVTLRTSIIGPELEGARSLLSWFLAQQGSVRGFTRAVFSGLPTVELTRVIRDHVIADPSLRGVFHVSSEPISKFDLLSLVAKEYRKEIKIIPCDQPIIDRSLDSTRFGQATGYVAPSWPELVRRMHASC